METKILFKLNELFKGKTLNIISLKPELQIDFNERIVVENNVLTVHKYDVLKDLLNKYHFDLRIKNVI